MTIPLSKPAAQSRIDVVGIMRDAIDGEGDWEPRMLLAVRAVAALIKADRVYDDALIVYGRNSRPHIEAAERRAAALAAIGDPT